MYVYTIQIHIPLHTHIFICIHIGTSYVNDFSNMCIYFHWHTFIKQFPKTAYICTSKINLVISFSLLLTIFAINQEKFHWNMFKYFIYFLLHCYILRPEGFSLLFLTLSYCIFQDWHTFCIIQARMKYKFRLYFVNKKIAFFAFLLISFSS